MIFTSGVPKKDVFFHIIEPPEHGTLNFNPSTELNVLSLESFEKSGILYTHAGRENAGRFYKNNIFAGSFK